MLRLLVRWILHAMALLIVTYFVPGFHVATLAAALITAIIIGFLNSTLGALLKILTLPLGMLTLGLFFLVINAFMLIVASRITPGFHVASFGAAFVGALILAILNMLFDGLTDRSDIREGSRRV